MTPVQKTMPKKRRVNLLVEGLLVLIALGVIVPLAWTVLYAFLPNRAIISPTWDFPLWLGNFDIIFRDGTFAIQILNSVLIVIGTVFLCLAIGTIGGYALAKMSHPRWLVIPAIVFAGALPLIPPITLVPGMFVQFINMGLIGTVSALILANTLFSLPFAVLLMTSYFSSIPTELRESALVDGAGEFRTFRSIMLPLVLPGVTATGIFVGIQAWNEFLFGLTLTSGGGTSPVTVGIAALLQEYAVTWGELSAAGTVAAVPMILLAIFANRFIVAGLLAGSVKG